MNKSSKSAVWFASLRVIIIIFLFDDKANTFMLHLHGLVYYQRLIKAQRQNIPSHSAGLEKSIARTSRERRSGIDRKEDGKFQPTGWRCTEGSGYSLPCNVAIRPSTEPFREKGSLIVSTQFHSFAHTTLKPEKFTAQRTLAIKSSVYDVTISKRFRTSIRKVGGMKGKMKACRIALTTEGARADISVCLLCSAT